MKHIGFAILAAFLIAALSPVSVNAEILAMMNYESKTEKAQKAMGMKGPYKRREGIAIVDVDPNSDKFGSIVMDVPLPPDLVAHHIFYDHEQEKAYMTSLGKSELHVFDLDQFPYKMKRLDMPDCKMGEDVVFSEDNKTWYLTCMMSARVIVGDVATDKVKKIIEIPNSYPHGIMLMDDIDRLLVTSTVSGDLKVAHEEVIVLEASTGKVLQRVKVSNKKSPSGAAPVEVLRVPGTNPPVVYTTNMFGATLWALTWSPSKKSFSGQQVFDFNPMKASVVLEMYFNKTHDRLYVTSGVPGGMHTFDISGGPMKPKLISTIKAGAGAHHVAFTKDDKYAFVQSTLLNLPGLDDGSVTVVDRKSGKAIKSMDTLKNMGLNPNLIVLLPKWNSSGGH
ncbi:MAG: YncE family protein [Rhodospirillales bacterium]|nr:YncE family protein [Rhodospirillales bacterium]